MSMLTATVSELWRYPVKSMQGERVDASDVGDAGLDGDRAYAVVDPATGKVGSAKHPRLWSELLQCRARFLGTPPPVRHSRRCRSRCPTATRREATIRRSTDISPRCSVGRCS